MSASALSMRGLSSPSLSTIPVPRSVALSTSTVPVPKLFAPSLSAFDMPVTILRLFFFSFL